MMQRRLRDAAERRRRSKIITPNKPKAQFGVIHMELRSSSM
jgi:hypothetical protein